MLLDVKTNTLEPNELSSAFRKITSIAEEMRAILLEQAKDAACAGETGWLAQVSGDARDIDANIAKIETVGARLLEILTSTLGFENLTGEKHSSGNFALTVAYPAGAAKRLRRIRKQISQGDINQNLLTLTAARKSGYVSIGEKFKIILPDGTAFETDLIEPGNRLRERSWIKKFYVLENILANDFISLTEVEPRVWKLTKESSAKSDQGVSAS